MKMTSSSSCFPDTITIYQKTSKLMSLKTLKLASKRRSLNTIDSQSMLSYTRTSSSFSRKSTGKTITKLEDKRSRMILKKAINGLLSA